MHALEDWSDAKNALDPYQQSFRALDKEVKGTIEAKGLEPGVYRCGRFVVTIAENDEKHVEFERKSGRAVRIRPQRDEDD